MIAQVHASYDNDDTMIQNGKMTNYINDTIPHIQYVFAIGMAKEEKSGWELAMVLMIQTRNNSICFY